MLRLLLSTPKLAIIDIGHLATYVSKYRSVLGKRPWALKHNSQFCPTWALTRDQNSIRLYRSCYIDPLKWGTWALTREWALARDTTVSKNGAS